jgi:hypothetical protein
LSLGVHTTYSYQNVRFESSAAIAEMLETNSTLECLEEEESGGIHSGAASLKRFHNTFAKNPLELSFKLAFISVFDASRVRAASGKRRRAKSKASTVVSELDPHILHIIFEFVVTCVRCGVFIRRS